MNSFSLSSTNLTNKMAFTYFDPTKPLRPAGYPEPSAPPAPESDQQVVFTSAGTKRKRDAR